MVYDPNYIPEYWYSIPITTLREQAETEKDLEMCRKLAKTYLKSVGELAFLTILLAELEMTAKDFSSLDLISDTADWNSIENMLIRGKFIKPDGRGRFELGAKWIK